MEPTKPKLPSEAIELYNLFIHGEISRRAFMDGVQRFAVGGLAAAAIVEALMPNYALGQQVSKTDDRIKATYETVPSPQGNGSIKGYLVRPVSADTRDATPAKLPGIIVVHENRGLNPHIEDIARRLALANFMAFAPDGLTSLGGFPGDDYKGGQMFSKVDGKKMAEDFVAAAMWLKARPDCTGKIGVTGFCYGGGISNTLAVRLGADLGGRGCRSTAAVPAKDDIPKIKAAILVHHGELDTRLAATWPAYDTALKAATFRTKATSTRARFTASIATRRRNATTKPRPTWPGSARSTGSTNTYARKLSCYVVIARQSSFTIRVDRSGDVEVRSRIPAGDTTHLIAM